MACVESRADPLSHSGLVGELIEFGKYLILLCQIVCSEKVMGETGFLELIAYVHGCQQDLLVKELHV